MGVLSNFNLKPFVDVGYRTFVETGTGAGNGVDYALSCGFDRLFSVEFVPEQAAKMRTKYQSTPVTIRDGHSPDFLDALFTSGEIAQDERCVFFLDAHFPESDVFGKPYDYEKDIDKRLPLEAELDVLFKHKRTKDLIIIDDLRIYERCPHGVQNLDQMGLAHIARYDAPDFLTRWQKTHVVDKLYMHEGYVLMTPRA